MNLELERKRFLCWWSNAKCTLKCDEYDAFEIWLASVNREGYKLVPVEPTEKMIVASFAHRDCGDDYCIADIYKEMIGACDE